MVPTCTRGIVDMIPARDQMDRRGFLKGLETVAGTELPVLAR